MILSKNITIIKNLAKRKLSDDVVFGTNFWDRSQLELTVTRRARDIGSRLPGAVATLPSFWQNISYLVVS